MTGQRIQQEAICYQWFKQQLILSVSEPSISQRSQIKEDTVEPSVPAWEFNLKAYAAITWEWDNDPASRCLEPRLADHRSQAARTATLPIAPPRQAEIQCNNNNNNNNNIQLLTCHMSTDRVKIIAGQLLCNSVTSSYIIGTFIIFNFKSVISVDLLRNT